MAQHTKPLAIGFIGGSLQSAVGYAHFASCQMDNHWSVEAGCFSRDLHVNQATGQVYGIHSDRVYADWQTLLDQEKCTLDAILVLTPTPSHYEIVIGCLEAGIPVICEKALALNTQQAKEILAIQKAHQGFLVVTYNYSGYPMLRVLRQRIRNGKLGKIMHFQAEMPQEGFIRTDAQGDKLIPQAWRLVDTQLVPMLYLDLAVHLHQLIDYLLGEKPLAVVAHHASHGWFEAIDNAICLARYTQNIQGQFWFSKSALGHRNGLKLRIFGTNASAEWHQAYPEELLLAHLNGQREVLDRVSSGVELANTLPYNRFKAGHPAGFIEAFANLYIDIANCLWQYKKTGAWQSDEVYSSDLTLENLHFLEAISNSVKQNAWQTIANEPKTQGA